MWDAEVEKIRPSQSNVSSVEFSPDGSGILFAGDGTSFDDEP